MNAEGHTELEVPVECVDHGCDSDSCLAGCLCSRCDEARSENGPLFGEAQ